MKIPIGKIVLRGNERRYVAEAMESGWISSKGPFVERFEAEFANYIGVKHAVSTCNGTAALHLMLASLGIGTGDEVIVPTLTFPATANMVRLCGAKVVLCDVDAQTWTMNPYQMGPKVNGNTRAVLTVSLYGHPTFGMMSGSDKLLHLEDAAQGLGGRIWDDDPLSDIQKPPRKVGSLAHATTFSFYGNKTLTCGEGGMITTDDDELAAKMRRLRAHGEDPSCKFWFPEFGFNYRMSNLHAAIGCAQLERIEDMVIARNQIAARYIERLMPLIKEGRIRTQHFGGLDCRHAWWMFSIVLQRDSEWHSERHMFQTRLIMDGIETRPILTPLHLMPVYAEPIGTYPVAEAIALNGLNLPTYEGLSESEQDYICERVIHHLG